MKTVKISVTEQDIKEGSRGDCRFCPVALAIGRVIKYGKRISVEYRHLNIIDKSNIPVRYKTCFILPLKVTEFVEKFDLSFTIGLKPFEFDLEFPENQD
jgi:hypothetical protein